MVGRNTSTVSHVEMEKLCTVLNIMFLISSPDTGTQTPQLQFYHDAVICSIRLNMILVKNRLKQTHAEKLFHFISYKPDFSNQKFFGLNIGRLENPSLQATEMMTKSRSLAVKWILWLCVSYRKQLQTEINTSCKQAQQPFSTPAHEEAACLPLSTVHQVCVGIQTPIFAFFLLVCVFFKENIIDLSGCRPHR